MLWCPCFACSFCISAIDTLGVQIDDGIMSLYSVSLLKVGIKNPYNASPVASVCRRSNYFFFLCGCRKAPTCINGLPTNVLLTSRAWKSSVSKQAVQKHTKDFYAPRIHVFATFSRNDALVCWTIKLWLMCVIRKFLNFSVLLWAYPQGTRVVCVFAALLVVEAFSSFFELLSVHASFCLYRYIYTLRAQILVTSFLSAPASGLE